VREREIDRFGREGIGGGMGEEEKETTTKNVGVVFKNIFYALNLAFSHMTCNIAFIRYSNDV
jgi:hypothetical protein